MTEMDNSQSVLEREMPRVNSSPRLTPSPDSTTEPADLKLSRKREREVSLEPVTTPSAMNDDMHAPFRERKDSQIPLKKNRRRLDPTQEEEDGGGSGSGSGSGSPPNPPPLASPRQEMKRKVRQISRGVEDINWKNIKPSNDSIADAESGALEPAIELASDQDPNHEKVDNDAVIDNVTMAADEDESPPKTPDDSLLSRSVHEAQPTEPSKITDVLASTRPESLLPDESNEKGLKRKFLERGTSHGPPEVEETSKTLDEPLKRPRDDFEDDANPRETKRLSPPPSPPRPTPPSPKVPKKGGFMAYASNNSPFASVKGQNLFSSHKASSPPPLFPGSSSSAPSPSLAEFIAPSVRPSVKPSSSSTPIALRRSGFESFASTSSPFASASRAKSQILGSATSKLGRAKSPPRKAASVNNAFASYAGHTQSFALPAQKRARAGSPEGSSRSSLERGLSVSVFGGSALGSESGDEDDLDEEPTTFGEKLRAGKDEDDDISPDEDSKIRLTEQDVTTGEEEEETLHQVRGKLFSLDESQWRERGTGLLKLNVKQEDGTGARLVMRKDAVYTLLLNITLFPGMRCSVAQDPRYLRFSAIENGIFKTYNLKVSSAKMASDLLEEINANIPTT